MSNSIAPGSSANVNVRVTALTTNPNVPVTYKTIILKKNLVNGVNTLTQAMMNQTNTKYVIKYDYVLGEDITIPANCVLEFDGGSISGNNTLTLSNTIFDGNYDDAINVVLSGINITPNFRVGNTLSPNVAVSKLSTAYKGIFVIKNITLSNYVELHCDLTIANDATITCQSSVEHAIRLTSGIRVSGGTIIKQIEKIDNRDTFRRNAFYAFNVHDVIIENCNISGGFYFETRKNAADNEPCENIIIQNCRINVDFTAIKDWGEEPVGAQNDIFHFAGYSNVIISNNLIKGLNHMRVFKITGITNGADYSTQYHTPKNFVINNNIIDSTSCKISSCQLLDSFCGTEKLIITNNIIKARNHIHLFEQKSTQQNYPAQIIIEDNKINTNVDVLYIYMTPNDTVHFDRNIVDVESGEYLAADELLIVKDSSFYCKENVFNGNGNIQDGNAIIVVHNNVSGQRFVKKAVFEGNTLNNFGRVHLYAERVICKNNISDSQDYYCLRFNTKRLIYINNDTRCSYQINIVPGNHILEYLLVFMKDNENLICDVSYLSEQTIAEILDIVQGSQVKSNTTNMIYFGKSL